MPRVDKDDRARPRARRAPALLLLLTAAVGCSGEPAPLRLDDREKARESILKKTDKPDRRPAPSRR